MNNIYYGRMLAATPRILPAVYDDAMTYLEQLHILNDKLNEVITVFNDYGDTMLDQSKQYTDSQIALVKGEFDTQLAAIQTSLNQQFAALEAEITKELAEALSEFKDVGNQLLAEFAEQTKKLNSQIAQLQISVNVLFEVQGRNKLEMRQEMQRAINNVMQYVDDALAAKMGSQIIVNNPYRKSLTSLDIALADLFSITYNMFSLTVDEYKSLHLTVDEYQDCDMTANEYLYQARWFWIRELYFPDIDARFAKVYGYINEQVEMLDKNHYMISPFDGTVQPINRIVYQLARLHMYGITADQYLAATLTADAYKEKQITAHDYAWNGYYLIYTDATPLPTLEEQLHEAEEQIAALTQRVIQLEQGAVPSTVIKQMQDDINATKSNLSDLETKQTETDNEIVDIKDNVIPTEIDSLHSTLNTVDQGLQTQITQIDSGLKSIHINYTATTFNP